MEAKDTIMDKKDCFMVEGEDVSDFGLQQRLQAQAEISFKAGIKEATNIFHKAIIDGYMDEYKNAGMKVGRREVVEWIKVNANIDSVRDEWQAKLREWNISA